MTVNLTDLPRDIRARLVAYAEQQGVIEVDIAIADLVRVALDHLDARAAGGKARAKALTKTQRRAIAKRAAAARWTTKEAK